MSLSFHWSKEDYFPYLLKPFKVATLALEYLGKTISTLQYIQYL